MGKKKCLGVEIYLVDNEIYQRGYTLVVLHYWLSHNKKYHTRSSSAPASVWYSYNNDRAIEKRFSNHYQKHHQEEQAPPSSASSEEQLKQQQCIIVRVGTTTTIKTRRESNCNNHMRRIVPWDATILPTKELTKTLLNPKLIKSPSYHHDNNSIHTLPLQYQFSTSRKRLIILLVSIAAFFAPFSANSYFPAMGNIEKELSVTSQQVNLSVTVFMIFQAISPSFWSTLADSHGRRPIYLYTLFIYILACIGIALCQQYWLLLTFRMLQAFGASSVISIGAGTISDITTPAERGGYIGWFSLGSNLGPLIGPAFGGFLSEFLGWRWIFWISAATCCIHLIILGFILPETLHSLVSNDGSCYANPTPTQWWKRRKLQKQQQQNKNEYYTDSDNENIDSSSTFSISSTAATVVAPDSTNDKHYQKHQEMSSPTMKKENKSSTTTTSNSKLSFWHIITLPLQPLVYAKEKDVLALLIFYSGQYAACYAITTSLPYLFSRTYILTESQIGASYLANGFGCVMGAVIQGRMLNQNYQKMQQEQQQKEPNPDTIIDDNDLPIEHARLRMSWFHALISNLIIACYGWCLYLKAHLAIILGLHFVLGFTSQVIFNAVQTLLVDLFPERSATITATNNVFRCLFGAVATTLVLPLIQIIGVGLYLELRRGAIWRRKRVNRNL
ncbi:major facilitator superfamily domain-containing protein [Circinella umbellata]|nr:major facilitator superfamily domain-containing protein [Circinella umbellata]